MEKIIKIVFDNETDAFKASQQLQQLDRNGHLSIAETIILSKGESGESTLKDIKGNRIPYTLGGALTGSLLGILGGPFGVLWGASLGLMVGATGDLIRSDRRASYLEKLAQSVPNGKTVVVIHADEYWTTPLDTTLAGFHAEITRYEVDGEIEEAIKKELNAVEKEIDKLAVSLNEAVGEAKAEIGEQLDKLKEQRDELKASIREKTVAQRKQYESWLDKVKAKLKDWKEEVEEEIDEFKEELAENRQERLEKRIARQEERLAKLKSRQDD